MMEVSPLRAKVLERSGGFCEAMVALPRSWARCGRSPVDDHHALPRSRGGSLLDEVGEMYHHIALCRFHHSQVDEYGFDSGLLIAGYAYRDGTRIVYQGPDEHLTRVYGSVDMSDLRKVLPGSDSGQGLRGKA